MSEGLAGAKRMLAEDSVRANWGLTRGRRGLLNGGSETRGGPEIERGL
jgi:hypothetical protein